MDALYRIDVGGEARLALGPRDHGPQRMIAGDLTVDGLLRGGAKDMWQVLDAAPTTAVPAGARLLAPIESQEVWAAGVTYAPSRDARMAESVASASVYDAVFGAERPELFYKSAGSRVRGPGGEINVRSDSTWDVPEPEVAVVITAGGEIAAITVGNDVSSRSIEGANPLYLPQAKVYEGGCALGPCLVRPRPGIAYDVTLVIERDGEQIFRGATSSDRMVRSFEQLVAWLYRAVEFPVGAVLLTGTGIVPTPEFTLRGGDRVSIDIAGLGTLVNGVRRLDCGAPPGDE